MISQYQSVANKTSKMRRKESLAGISYLMPALVALSLVSVIPSIYNIYISFTNYGLYHYFEYSSIGFSNYAEIFEVKGAFLPVLGWTVIWTVVCSVLNVGIGLLIAMVLNNPNLRERNLYRTLLIIPWALPGVIAIQMWRGMLSPDGVFNQLLALINVPAVNWLSDPVTARISVITVNVWLSFPYFMTVCLAALQSIPSELYEAAITDGAGKFQKFRFITIPMLKNALTPLFITQLAFQFNNFNMIYLLTQGGPRQALGEYYGSTDILVSYTFNLMRELQRYGLTAAYGVVIFMITSLIMILSSISTKSFSEV